jgi:hypothetical protein
VHLSSAANDKLIHQIIGLATKVDSHEGGGFATLENRVADFEALILRRNNTAPSVCVPWRVWARQLKGVRE